MLKKYLFQQNRWLFSFIILTFTSTNSFVFSADEKAAQDKINVRLKPSYPEKHIVVKGDTLWDIAEIFLQNPWVWPQIWDVNPQIKNPHLIYPGDVVTLIHIDEKPRLHVERPEGVVEELGGAITDPEEAITQRAKEDEPETEMVKEEDEPEIKMVKGNEGEYKTIKLVPKIRYVVEDAPIETIESSAIQSFLVRPQVFTEDEYSKLPYVLGNYEGKVLSGLGDKVYVKGLIDSNNFRYSVYHKGEELKDPISQEVLGYQAILVGEVKVKKFGNPSTMFVTSSKREISVDDRLVLSDQSNISHNLLPSVSEVEFDGRIIALFDALTQSARNQVVVVNIGKRDGIEIGNILSIERFGGVYDDKNDLNEDGELTKVTIPNVRSGTLLIFKVFERVAYGLIMESNRAIRIGDAVSTPN